MPNGERGGPPSSDVWDEDAAARYDGQAAAARFAPDELDPAVEFLARLAGDGPALEFAVGTGRVAVPLAARGVPVSGVELSRPMVDRLRRKVSERELPVVAGDMATAVVPGEFALVYLVWNTLGNLLTQDEQVRCFRNAARHLRPGGRFVVEIGVPDLRLFPPGARGVPFEVGDRHVGLDTLDPVTQRGTSHHYWHDDDGTIHHGTSNFRYVWPSECDLMARLAGLEFSDRFGGWDRRPFTADSGAHVSVWRKAAEPAGPAADG